MTQSKNYNLKVYCDLKNIAHESEEAIEFFDKKFYEQLTIIKELRASLKKPDEEQLVEEGIKSYSLIDRLRGNV